MRYLSIFLLSLLLSTGLQAQLIRARVAADTLHLNVVIPEEDTVMYSYPRYRVAANTHPEAEAFINGKKVKVYSTGAFVDLIEHDSDTTEITFMVTLKSDTLSKTMYLIRPIEKILEFEGKVISEYMLEPGGDLWLQSGEKLNVQFLGTPGEEVVFNIDGFKRNIPMQEMPAEATGGLKGVYRGSYTVKPGDVIKDRRVTFKMKRNIFSYLKRSSEFRVSFNGTPRTGEVISDYAYLNVGMGKDRLGGAKYGIIDEGVRLNITGMKEGNYRVKLSESLSAWIPARFVKLLPEYEEEAGSLAGTIRVRGGQNEDIVTLSLGEKLPYISYQEVDPNRIIVDVFGATSNTNWKTKLKSSQGIKKVDWQQVENDRYRLIIEIDHKQNWGYSVDYGWGSQLRVRVKRPPAITNIQKPLTGRLIAVDAGHGGSSKGALGASGAMEKEVTLQIAKKLEQALKEAGAEVLMTRSEDTDVSMSERREKILESGADLLVSIHANSIGYLSDPLGISGTGAFYKHMAYRPLAVQMYDMMLELGLEDYGMTGSFNFSLNAPIEFPNVLVETAFMSNPEDEEKLVDPQFQMEIARKITKGLEAYYLGNAHLKTVDEMPEK